MLNFRGAIQVFASSKLDLSPSASQKVLEKANAEAFPPIMKSTLIYDFITQFPRICRTLVDAIFLSSNANFLIRADSLSMCYKVCYTYPGENANVILDSQ